MPTFPYVRYAKVGKCRCIWSEKTSIRLVATTRLRRENSSSSCAASMSMLARISRRLVLRHAVRIARYLYPHAYLSAASAVLLGPTRDGRLFLSGRRIQRTRLRSTRPVPHLAKRSLGNSSSGQKKTGQTSGREEAGLIRLPADDRRRLLLRMPQSQARGSRSNVPFTQQPTCETMQMRRVSWPLLSHYVCFLAIKGSSIASDCACSSSRPELMRS
ncbi:hypothetical protein EV129_10493 [Rhizobium azibense]|uniref:Uncharacterized protein n=1 Tax=Rhizobium azibense TaxID=1136135 RepID=A0A4R3RR52_9HYPH|nr:hypothetical protein EV129_10493 [Rhizobium azibense]